MDWFADFGNWAWARHHNEWSWYIRPVFLVPYCWFAWRRSLAGLAVVLLVLATSMFWFPEPATPSPQAREVLAAELAYLRGPWTWWMVAIALLIPATFGGLALAFWRRSFVWGIAVVNAMAFLKIAWSFAFFTTAGALHHLVPALFGLAVCNGVLLAAALAWQRRRRRPAPSSSFSSRE